MAGEESLRNIVVADFLLVEVITPILYDLVDKVIWNVTFRGARPKDSLTVNSHKSKKGNKKRKKTADKSPTSQKLTDSCAKKLKTKAKKLKHVVNTGVTINQW